MELRTDRPRERARTLCEFNKRSPRNMHTDGGMGGGNGSGAADQGDGLLPLFSKRDVWEDHLRKPSEPPWDHRDTIL